LERFKKIEKNNFMIRDKKVLLIFITMIFAFKFIYTGNCYSQNISTSFINDTSSTYALVVGISGYQNIKPLKYADDDAYLFSQFLINENICNKDKLYLLVDSLATTANFYRDLKKILYKVKSNDRVFLYFAGHGDVETELESGFLLTYNSEKNNYPASSIDIMMLEKHVNALVNKNVSVVLITDACRSGNLVGGIGGATVTMNSIYKGFNNVIKLTSCLPNQLSQEKKFNTGGHGVFTYYLVNGLSGLADKNNDNEISLREIDNYLDEVSSETEQKQIPKVDGNPLSVINEYNPDIKASIRSQKGSLNIVSRSIENIEDTNWNKNQYYIQYLKKIQEGIYFSGITSSATSIIKQAKLDNQPEAMLTSMSLDLIAILEDKAQLVINKILQGEFSNQSQKETRIIHNAIDCLKNVLDLMEENDFRKTDIQSKIIYFNCLDATIRRNKSKMFFYANNLEKIDSLISNQAWIKNLLGLTYYYLGFNNKSKNFLLQATKIAPSWSSAWNNLGLVYDALNMDDSSKIAYHKSIELEGANDFGNGTALSNMQSLYIKSKDTLAAENACLASILKNGNNPYPYFHLGDIYEAKGEFIKAEEYYLKGINLDSIVSDYWLQLANFYLRTKNNKRLDFCLSKTVSCDSTDLSSWLAVENIYNSIGNKKKAKEIAVNATRFFCKRPDQLSNSYEFSDISELYYKIDELDSALKYINRAISLDPTNSFPLFQKSILEIEKKNFFQADSSLEIALKIEPQNKYILLQKGKLYFNYLDKDTLALELFKRVIKMDSTDQEANWYMGRIYFWNSLFDSASLYFNKAVKYDSSDAYNWYWLGLSKLYYFLEKDTTSHFSDYEFLKSLKTSPKLNKANWYIACIAYLNGDKKRAINHFKQSLLKNYYDLDILDINSRLKRIKSDMDFKFATSRQKYKK